VNRSSNHILASLSEEVFAALRPHLSAIEFKHGAVLAEPGAAIRNVYFPHGGIISFVVELNSGEMIETAMVGKDGVVNAASALDGKVSLNKTIVQLAGAGSVVSADVLRMVADEFADFRALLNRHEQVLFAQSQQSAACNASHLVEARLCRWLLRTRDLADSEDLTITQEFLAQMLGVRRSSLSVVAHTLQKAGFIRYRRGHVRILDRPGLEEAACECYGVVKAHYDRLLMSGTSHSLARSPREPTDSRGSDDLGTVT
jgi:CRP-like cAMP-binding protein